MTTYRKIIILPAQNCRHSRKVIEYLEAHHTLLMLLSLKPAFQAMRKGQVE